MTTLMLKTIILLIQTTLLYPLSSSHPTRQVDSSDVLLMADALSLLYHNTYRCLILYNSNAVKMFSIKQNWDC